MSARIEELLAGFFAARGKEQGAAARALLDEAQAAGRAEIDRCVGALTDGLAAVPLAEIGMRAVLSGALVEGGGNPAIGTGAMLARLRAAFDESAPDPRGLDDLCRAAITFLSRDDAARNGIPDRAALVARAAGLGKQGVSFARWLAQLLAVEDEEILVVEPAAERAWRMRSSGVADNFQLHALLIEALAPGTLPRETAAVWRGEGPQQIKGGTTGRWNLYDWRALGPDGVLPAPSLAARESWIWGEGVPADIPTFEGRRTILIGPPSYRRDWNTSRAFSGLRARLEILEELPAKDVVTRMVADKRH